MFEFAFLGGFASQNKPIFGDLIHGYSIFYDAYPWWNKSLRKTSKLEKILALPKFILFHKSLFKTVKKTFDRHSLVFFDVDIRLNTAYLSQMSHFYGKSLT